MIVFITNDATMRDRVQRLSPLSVPEGENPEMLFWFAMDIIESEKKSNDIEVVGSIFNDYNQVYSLESFEKEFNQGNLGIDDESHYIVFVKINWRKP